MTLSRKSKLSGKWNTLTELYWQFLACFINENIEVNCIQAGLCIPLNNIVYTYVVDNVHVICLVYDTICDSDNENQYFTFPHTAFILRSVLKKRSVPGCLPVPFFHNCLYAFCSSKYQISFSNISIKHNVISWCLYRWFFLNDIWRLQIIDVGLKYWFFSCIIKINNCVCDSYIILTWNICLFISHCFACDVIYGAKK